MEKIKIKFKHKRYFLLQRNKYLSPFQKKIRRLFGRFLFTNFFIFFFNSTSRINSKLDMESKIEFNELINFLPSKINNVVDIGAGLGIINIFLEKHFTNNINFTLIDKNRIEKKVSYGFCPDGEFYNNFSLTADFLKNHGIDMNKIKLIDADDKNIINNKFDLVISLLSMGYHYPINQYLSFLKKNTHKNTIFIFDVAFENEEINIISQLFKNVETVKKSKEVRHNYIRVCCRELL